MAAKLTVNCQLERIIYHSRQNAPEYSRAFIQAWVGVALDEPHREVVITHEIVAKDLKAAFHSLWI